MTIVRGLSALVLSLGLVACSGPTQGSGSGSVAPSTAITSSQQTVVTTMATASSGCRHALQVASAEPDPVRADPLIRASLDACSTADEWLAALREYPRAMGLTTTANITDLDLKAACYGSEQRAVCRDAQAGGRL